MILKFFCRRTNKIQVFNYATVETFLKTVWTHLTTQETARQIDGYPGMLLTRMQKDWRI